MPDRLTRQRRLAEVGERGQERIQNASARVAKTAAGAIEALYLGRAGVSRIELADEVEPVEFAHAACFRHAASQEVAEGSWRALATIVNALQKAQE